MNLRRRRLSPDFIAAPAEPPVPVEVRIADLDAQAREAFLAGDKAKADRLLDLRNAIRPASHVDSIIDNRRENP